MDNIEYFSLKEQQCHWRYVTVRFAAAINFPDVPAACAGRRGVHRASPQTLKSINEPRAFRTVSARPRL
ncbi:MAG: hypothetical protein KF684_03905 [Phycisphaeraceae bacterium]|nr:hypothetical protein [Phycisphaeraceae bacterium]